MTSTATISAAALIVGLVAGGVTAYRYEHAQAEAAMNAHLADDRAADENAQRVARMHEYELALSANAAAQSYEQGKTDAQVTSDRVVAGLRDGTLRLRDRWQGCEASRSALVSQAAASAGELDAVAADRAASAGRAIAAAAACDAHVRGLQALLSAERKQ